MNTWHVYPWVRTKCISQVPTEDPSQSTTCTSKIRTNTIHSKSPNNHSRYFSLHIRREDPSHPVSGGDICMLLTCSRPHYGRNQELHHIEAIERGGATRGGSKAVLRLLCNAYKCRSEICGEQHALGSALQCILSVRTRCKNQILRTLLFRQAQQWSLWKWNHLDPLQYHQTCHNLSFRSRNCCIILQLQISGPVESRVGRDGASTNQDNSHNIQFVCTRTHHQDNDSQSS